MKVNVLKYFMVFLLVVQSLSITAQQFRSSYFLEDFNYSHDINPAFMPESNYISFPALGHVGVGMQSNVGLENFLFPSTDTEYALTTFMSSSVDADQFLSGLPENSVMDMNINMTPLSFGFYAWGGFNTFDMSVNSNSMVDIPYELFNFLKNGTSNLDGTVYNIENLSVRTNNYAEFSLGHARKINDKLTIGAKFKAYVGAAALDANLNQLRISMSSDKWEISSDAEMNISASGVVLETEADENGKYLSGFDISSPGIGGSGFGIDLGASYEVQEGLLLSAAIHDLGVISWNSTIKTYTKSDKFIFEGFDELSFIDDKADENSNSLENQIDDLSDDLMKLTNLYVSSDESGINKYMPMILNFGVEYNMPFYNRLSVGALSYSRFNEVNPWTEGRLSANITPLDFLSLSVSYGISNYGNYMGWMLNLHPKGINLYIGSDNMFTRVSPQYIPIERMSASFYMGMNITFGHKNR